MVDTEAFFQTLGDNTHLMVLEKGQKWTPVSVLSGQLLGRLLTYGSVVPTLGLTGPLSKYFLCVHLITGSPTLQGCFQLFLGNLASL